MSSTRQAQNADEGMGLERVIQDNRLPLVSQIGGRTGSACSCSKEKGQDVPHLETAPAQSEPTICRLKMRRWAAEEHQQSYRQ